VTIDQALDRIALGVTRLHENATAIKSELQVQNTLLDETEAKLDKVTGNLKGVNKKLKETLKQVDKDRLCVYLFCCIILLGIAGGIYFVVFKNK
jgi:chromosome segregation ATPase